MNNNLLTKEERAAITGDGYAVITFRYETNRPLHEVAEAVAEEISYGEAAQACSALLYNWTCYDGGRPIDISAVGAHLREWSEQS